MRRFVSLLSLVVMLVGLELGVEMVSLTWARIGAGVSAITNGLEMHVSPARFVTGVLLFVGGFTVWFAVTWLGRMEQRISAVGDYCPRCRSETKRVKRSRFQRIVSSAMRDEVASRECDQCGWSGLALKY